MQSLSQIITTNKPTPSFLQAGCPSCHPTNSVKALKGKISHSLDLFSSPKLTWGLPTLSLTTNSSWLSWGSVAVPLISPLMPVPRSLLGLNIEKHALPCNAFFIEKSFSLLISVLQHLYSYPAVLVVPQTTSDDSIQKFARGYRQNRFHIYRLSIPTLLFLLLFCITYGLNM